MKTFLQISAIAILFFTTSFASAQQSNNIVVFSQDGYRFTLIVNGLKQNEKPETNVKVVGLNAPNYKVRVIFEDTKMAPIDQNVYMMDGGENVTNKEFTYAIAQGKNGLKLKGQSVADITGTSTSSATQVVYQYNPAGSVMIGGTSTTVSTTTTGTTTTNDPNAGNVSTGTTVTDGTGATTTTTTTTTSSADGANVGVNAGGVGVNINITGMGPATGSSTTTTTTTSSTTTSSNTNTQSTGATTASNTANVCAFPMSESDFTNAKASIDKQSFEEGKLKVAKQILNSNCMSTAQVKEIMGMFSFEDNKLDWAKFAYGKTTDPNNYYQLNDGFSFSSSTDALDEYIKQHPHQ
ncbi:MAG: DUF4476 domain-containing protein [Bacteroidetes bacterium]|nr:DUF4476 domain-containing protein [Bacteroidota bacterium]